MVNQSLAGKNIKPEKKIESLKKFVLLVDQ